MKAQEVLRRYAAGKRDFRGANLRGANFKGQDLSGADFSSADIRSANFSNAVLKGVNFTQAQAGLQRRWVVIQIALVVVIAVIAGILQGFAGIFSAVLLEPSNFSGPIEQSITVAIYLLLIVGTYVAISLQGFSIRAFGSIMTAVAFALAGAFAVAVAGAVAGAGAVAVAGAGAVAVAGAVAGLLFSLFAGWRVLKEDEKFDVARTIGLALSAVGGTSFCGADLTDVIFQKAQLKNTNFAKTRQQQTNLTHVDWQNAKRLNRARLGTSILQDRRVRTLLDGSQNGYKQNLSNANLRGANLSDIDLKEANLTRAVLNNALLNKTMLEGATLTEAQAVGADFMGAYLTGAKLEGWNIDSTTMLKDIDCRYVFLLEQPNQNGDQERRPHDPKKDFQPGDFEKFFKEMLDQVQILIRDGIHPKAFRAAFQSIMQQNPAITPEAITGYEKRGTDIMLTLQVPEGTNKAEIEQAWEQGYQTGLKAGRKQEKLENADFFKETTRLLAGKNITFENRNELMTGNDQSQNIGGNVNIDATNSVVSLRDISGQVNNQIAQLDNSSTQTQLKELLTQLETAIQSEPNLSEEQKTEALEEVKELAAAGQAPQEGRMKKAAKRAINTLKGMTTGVDTATKFVEACNGLLPAIGLLFGL